MARFVFKLEALLEARQRAEKDRQRELAERAAVVVECEQQLKNLDTQVKTATDDVRENHLTGKLDLNFLAAHRRFLGAMQRSAMDVVQKLANASKRVDEARVVLVEAAKQRKVIEKLREKQLERWKAEQARRELADLDEVGGQIAFSNLSEASRAEHE